MQTEIMTIAKVMTYKHLRSVVLGVFGKVSWINGLSSKKRE